MKLGILSAAFILIAGVASAKIVYYPEQYCSEILSSEYSTGNGDTAVEQLEILCKDSTGKHRVLVTSWTSVAGMFGFGRVAYETVIELVPYNGTELKAE